MVNKIKKRVFRELQKIYVPLRNKPKIFCIGRNKTGTTTIAYILNSLGYVVGNQALAELLIDDWAKRDFNRIIDYCKSAEAFQDIPFSLDYTYQIMDHVFPNSKFILTIRDSAEEWYESYIRFNKKRYKINHIPTPEYFKKDTYRNLGHRWKSTQYIYGVNEENFLDETLYKEHYIKHNADVIEYFRFRLEDLLVINLSDDNSMEKIYKFLNHPFNGQKMPHLNKSTE